MSRIGKAPITVPAKVTVTIDGTEVTVKGPKGELKQIIDTAVEVKVEDGTITLTRLNEEKDTRAKHGLYRSLLNNMVEGVSKGFSVKQELVGVGYRAKTTGQLLELSLGYSHPIVLEVPAEVKISSETLKGQNPTISMESHDKQLLGTVAAKIRSFRKPEPYKGKGIRFAGEQVRRKAGKSAGK
jgi:large subunit ribosomal protein L6